MIACLNYYNIAATSSPKHNEQTNKVHELLLRLLERIITRPDVLALLEEKTKVLIISNLTTKNNLSAMYKLAEMTLQEYQKTKHPHLAILIYMIFWPLFNSYSEQIIGLTSPEYMAQFAEIIIEHIHRPRTFLYIQISYANMVSVMEKFIQYFNSVKPEKKITEILARVEEYFYIDIYFLIEQYCQKWRQSLPSPKALAYYKAVHLPDKASEKLGLYETVMGEARKFFLSALDMVAADEGKRDFPEFKMYLASLLQANIARGYIFFSNFNQFVHSAIYKHKLMPQDCFKPLM